jgi:hypothetical protein
MEHQYDLLWNKIVFRDEECFSMKIHDMSCYIKRLKNKWLLYRERQDKAGSFSLKKIGDEDLPADVAWDHYISVRTTLFIVPALPDKPIIIKPQVAIHLLPKTSVDLFAYIPLWVQLYSGKQIRMNMITEFPSVELSATWFGEPDKGELAYSFDQKLKEQLKEEDLKPHLAVCPVKITNDSDHSLHFKQLSLHVENLDVYNDGNFVCTNQVKVLFKGEDHISNIALGQTKPSFQQELKQINTARQPQNKNIFKRSFSFFKTITDY